MKITSNLRGFRKGEGKEKGPQILKNFRNQVKS
jgi:hypothetical protein